MMKNIKFDAGALARELNISEITARLLVNRGIRNAAEARSFLHPELSQMNSPRAMKDLEKGVRLIKRDIEEKRKVMIVGDYDVDGVVSTYILFTALERCGADVCYEIPHRISDGYGINKSIIDKAAEQGVNTIITCDNGISALEAIRYAKDLGMDFIVTDHHDVPPFAEGDMAADAVVNPKQKDCGYPFKLLCGAGVAFKFVQVLFEEMGIDSAEALRYVHILAIATVCDVVDLTGENRIIVKTGLAEMPETDNLGLQELIRISNLEGKAITTYSLGFVIGPCINASGRLDWAKKGVELLLAKDRSTAEKLAKELYELNKDRKDMTVNGTAEVIEQIEQEDLLKHSVIVVYNGGIHESIAGIIAGRLKERYSRPAIMLTSGKEGAKGSGRSIDGYNMFEELSRCRDILGKFGGHPMAAGLSIEECNIVTLREMLNENSALLLEELVPKVSIDMQLPLDKATMDLAEEIACLEPFGTGNPKPVFADRGVRIHSAKIIGANKNVLKLSLKTARGNTLSGVCFGNVEGFAKIIEDKLGEGAAARLQERGLAGAELNLELDLAFNVDINEYMGSRSVQLNVKNFRKQ
ncbi:MAG: single-stranded-DNA-specific exonuclease RecJ [Firmicutes bacterium]|nr:single-stranded-DNA-specific exonuclease RecJ [Bacillota bacterium]